MSQKVTVCIQSEQILEGDISQAVHPHCRHTPSHTHMAKLHLIDEYRSHHTSHPSWRGQRAVTKVSNIRWKKCFSYFEKEENNEVVMQSLFYTLVPISSQLCSLWKSYGKCRKAQFARKRKKEPRRVIRGNVSGNETSRGLYEPKSTNL